MPESNSIKGCLFNATVGAALITGVFTIIAVLINKCPPPPPTPTPLPSPTQIATPNQTIAPNINSLTPNVTQQSSPPSVTPLPPTPQRTIIPTASDFERTFLDVDFEIISTGYSGGTYTVDLKITSNNKAQRVDIEGYYTKLYSGGTIHRLSRITFGDRTSFYQVSQRIPADVPVNAQVIFEGLSDNLQKIDALEIRVEVEESGAKKPMTLRFSNPDLNFKK